MASNTIATVDGPSSRRTTTARKSEINISDRKTGCWTGCLGGFGMGAPSRGGFILTTEASSRKGAIIGGGPPRLPISVQVAGQRREPDVTGRIRDCGLGIRRRSRMAGRVPARPVNPSVVVMQRRLGHASASMTLDVYAGLFGDDLDAVDNRLDEAVAARAADYLRTGTTDCSVINLGKRRSPGR